MRTQLSREEGTTHSSRSSGFSLVEVLIATSVLLIVTGGIMTLMMQSQQSYVKQHGLVEAVQTGRVAMAQITAFLRQAGNDPKGIGFDPIRIDNSNQFTIFSDVTGSVPDASNDPLQATGDPDGTLDNLYEQVTFRFDPNADELYINVGGGEQLLADHIQLTNLTFYDLAGSPTTNPTAIARVRVTMVVATDPDLQTGKADTLTLESNVMLRSQAYDVYGYTANQNYVSPPP